MNVFAGIPESELTQEKRSKAIRIINMIKQKKDRTIK